MKQLQTHFSWFRSFRYFWISAPLAVLFILFALINASLVLLAQRADTAAAQSVPTSQTTNFDTVSLPSLGITSRLVTVGQTSTNAIDVHPSLAGWWNGSAQPGSPGAVFLDGHNPGMFSKLPNIQTGAQISLTKASGEVFNYVVVYTETVQLEGIDMHRALSPYGGATEGLTIMTCMGTYNENTGTTDQRFVVYAVRS